MRVENTKTVLYRCLTHLIEVAKLQQKQIVCLRRKGYRLGKKLK